MKTMAIPLSLCCGLPDKDKGTDLCWVWLKFTSQVAKVEIICNMKCLKKVSFFRTCVTFVFLRQDTIFF